MASGWRRGFGNVRSFVGNSLGGLRGTSSLASWVVSGTLAYFLWVRPSQQLKMEQQERASWPPQQLLTLTDTLKSGNQFRMLRKLGWGKVVQMERKNLREPQKVPGPE